MTPPPTKVRPSTAGTPGASPHDSRTKLFLPAIEGFRGYATLSVLLTHVCLFAAVATPGRGALVQILVGGVADFFFVISGFVLFLPAVLQEGRFGSARAFALRRAARLLPLYYVSLLFVIVAHRWVASPVSEAASLPHQSAEGIVSLLLHVTFLHHFVSLMGEPLGFGNAVIWTLPVEVVFYLLLPLVVRRYYRHPFAMLAGAFALSGLWWLAVVRLPILVGWLPPSAYPHEPPPWQMALVTHAPSYLGHFALGMTAAWIFVKVRGSALEPLTRRIAPGVQLVAAFALLESLRDLGEGRIFGNPGHSIVRVPMAVWFTLLMLATVLAPRWAQWPATNRLARFFGDNCYGIYLFHVIFIGLAQTTFGLPVDGEISTFIKLLVFVLAGSSLLAYLSNRFVEKPLRDRAAAASRRIEASASTRTSIPPPPRTLPAVKGAEIS
ncbi:MAG: acyltransferase [Actinomycetota bacterium]|nr:acyltransferase [Actinomycetota bacterium]